MAFQKHRLACWAASLVAASAACTADAQIYTQPAPAAGQYAPQPPARQPVVRQQSPQQPTYPQYANQPPAQYSRPQAANPQQHQGQPAYPQTATQPGAYAQQPARQPMPAPSAAARGYANGRGIPAPGAVTYPEQNRGGGAAGSGVRPAQFEQPLDQQQAAPSDPPGFQATEVSSQPISATVPADAAGGQAAQEHPLMPAVRLARQRLIDINKIQDYSCTLVKRERIDGTLGEHEYIFVKVRHQPFSVYTYFLAPARLKGQEAIYVEGQNAGNLMGHGNGIKHRLIGTVSLKPTSALAMSGNRYPITETGMRRLLERLLEIGTNDMKFGECTVKWIQGAKINNRICTCIQVEHPVPRRNFLFHKAMIYVDDELQIPIRYEAFDWPARAGEPPQLTEEYTYLNVKLNNGFTDADFSNNNPSYGFR